MKYDSKSEFYQFITMTYNQGSIICEHLDSIKHQILTYGKGKDVILTILDDASIDDNVEVIKKWINNNLSMFINVELVFNKTNLGIKHNYLKSISKIVTPKYKLLAGDDLFISNANIFEFMDLCSSAKVVFSPYKKKNESDIYRKLNFNRLVFYKIFNSALVYSLQNVNLFSAPGSYVHLDILNRNDYLVYMESCDENYEDWPTWRYLFIDHDFDFLLIDKAFIEYRPQNNSIENNKANKFEFSMNSLRVKYYSFKFLFFHITSYILASLILVISFFIKPFIKSIS
jgi:glutaredoxin-related protein